MLYTPTSAGWKCPLCGTLLIIGRSDNFTRAAHARKHVREGLLVELGRRHSRGALRFEYTEAGERARTSP